MSPSDPFPSPFRAPIGATGGLGHGSRVPPRWGWKRYLLSSLLGPGADAPGYELSLLRSLRNCRARPGQDAGNTKENRSRGGWDSAPLLLEVNIRVHQSAGSTSRSVQGTRSELRPVPSRPISACRSIACSSPAGIRTSPVRTDDLLWTRL